MADDRIPLDNNRNLNAQEVAMKLCETTVPVDSNNNEYALNVLLNVSQIKDMLSKRGKLAYIGQSTNNIIPNNGELHRQFRLRKGATLSQAAASTTYETYTFVCSNWDGTSILDPFAGTEDRGVLYYNYDSRIEAEGGYYYMTSDKKYIKIGDLGVSQGGGIFVTVQYEEMAKYAVLAAGDWTLDVRELWNGAGKPTANGLCLYLYQSLWYSTWSGEGASIETKFSGVAIRWISAMKLYYKRYNQGVEQLNNASFPSSKYVYTQDPVFTFTGVSSVTSAAQTISIYVGVQDDVDWTATSNQSWATITSGSSGNGGGYITLSITANSSYTASRSVTITVKDSLNGSSSFSRNHIITQSKAQTTNKTLYVYYNSAYNRVELRENVNSSTRTSAPTTITVSFTVYDNTWGPLDGQATLQSGDETASVEWDSNTPSNANNVTLNSMNPTTYQSGGTTYTFEFASDLL